MVRGRRGTEVKRVRQDAGKQDPCDLGRDGLADAKVGVRDDGASRAPGPDVDVYGAVSDDGAILEGGKGN